LITIVSIDLELQRQLRNSTIAYIAALASALAWITGDHAILPTRMHMYIARRWSESSDSVLGGLDHGKSLRTVMHFMLPRMHLLLFNFPTVNLQPHSI